MVNTKLSHNTVIHIYSEGWIQRHFHVCKDDKPIKADFHLSFQTCTAGHMAYKSPLASEVTVGFLMVQKTGRIFFY